MIAVIPERKEGDAPWTIPLDMSRVPTESNSTQIGNAQLNAVLSNPNLPWSKELCVTVVDSAYGNKKFLIPLQEHQNSVIVARSRSNRVFYQSPIRSELPTRKGHPTWYGARFDLKAPHTWHEANEVAQTSYKNYLGQPILVTITLCLTCSCVGARICHPTSFPLLYCESRLPMSLDNPCFVPCG